MRISVGLAMLVAGFLLGFGDGSAFAQQKQTKDLGERLQVLHHKLMELNVQARARGPSAPGAKDSARHAVNPLYNIDRFDPVMARFVRFTIQATVDGQPPCLDELEIYGPAAQANLARAAGARATASSCIPGHPIHQIHHLNDGKYGNSHSWIGNEPGKGWAQIELANETKVDCVVWSRHCGAEPVFRDRLPIQYRIEVSVDGKNWQTVSTQEGRAKKVQDDPDPALALSLDPVSKKRYAEYFAEWKMLKGQADAAGEAAFQRAFKALKSVAAYGGPANDPKHINFVAIGGTVAQFPLHDGILKELTGLPHLSRLHLNWSGVTDAGLKHLANLHSIAELELESTRITDAGIRELKRMKGLVTLNLAGTRITNAGLKELCEIPQLSSLNLRGTGVTEDGLKILAAAKNLRHLTYYPITDRVVKNLNEIGKLSALHILSGRNPAGTDSLNLSYSQVTAAGVKEWKLVHLKHLNLTSTPTTDAQLEHLRDFRELQTLDLTRTQVSAAGMKHLKELKNLQSLKLSNTRVDGAGLKELADLPNLRLLYLGQCPVSDADLALLARFPSLEEVSFQKSNITDAGMKSLKQCKGLKAVFLTQLDITDAGLRELADLPELNLLVAGATKATAAGFKVFQQTKSLKTLVVFGGNFKNNAIQEVRQLLPGVEVRSWLGKR